MDHETERTGIYIDTREGTAIGRVAEFVADRDDLIAIGFDRERRVLQEEHFRHDRTFRVLGTRHLHETRTAKAAKGRCDSAKGRHLCTKSTSEMSVRYASTGKI